MTTKAYILTSLNQLKPEKTAFLSDPSQLVDNIFKSLMSKKFRKYSASPELIQHIKEALRINIEKDEPINITFLQGAYKLWRLEEAPEADWAELFTAMYYTKWVKDICGIYEHGVWFDFFVDDLIIPKMNNVTLVEVESYISSFQKILDFLKPYQPANLKMTITRVGDQFDSPQAFDESLEKNLEKIKATNPVFTERQLEMVELNVRPTPEQLKDPQWREKVRLIHDAYSPTKKEPGYHYRPEKILAFTQPLPSGTVIAVGTTKTSVAKHWVGIGALVKNGDSYKEFIFSPKQIPEQRFKAEEIELEGLDSKNFKTIRVAD